MANRITPTVNLVSGGSIGNHLYTTNSSTLNVSGGSIGYNLVAYSSSTVNFSGGSTTYELAALDSSKVSMSGGNVGSFLGAYSNSTISVSGGTFGQYYGVNFYDSTAGSFTLIGNNLTAANLGVGNIFGGTNYALSGTLKNGTNLSGYVLNLANGSTFTLQPVPEPGSVALLIGLGVTGAGWVARRRRQTPAALETQRHREKTGGGEEKKKGRTCCIVTGKRVATSGLLPLSTSPPYGII